jgi:beta-lactamase class A
MLDRRLLALGALALLAAPALAASPLSLLEPEMRRIEAEVGGRLGVAVLDTGSGAELRYRADERFPMCSTFKFLAAAAVLAEADAGRLRLDEHVRIEARDVVSHSPVTKARAVGDGMTLAGLGEAAVTRSDNTAANILVGRVGGPAGLTAFARSIGDPATRLDRVEPAMNKVSPGDPRDTTTPAAMLGNLRVLVLGDRLTPASRERLSAWLVGNKTGALRVRAGVPGDWRVGDKTGSCAHGSTNDVAVAWPPGRPPLIISTYLTQTSAPLERRSAALAAVAGAVASAYGR